MKRIIRSEVGICIIMVMLLSQASTAYASYADERWQWTDAGVQQERCTYRAWHEAYDRLGISLPLNWGNAATWASNASNQGYNVDETPRPDSIVCWGGGSGGWGHVAYVTGVSGDTVYIREGGINPSNGAYYRDTSFSNSNRDRWSGFWFNGYIHLKSTVYFNANGGSGGPSSMTKLAGNVPSIPTDTPSRSGYSFVRWNSSPDGSGAYSLNPGDTWGGDFDITFYAQWKATTGTIDVNTILDGQDTGAGTVLNGVRYGTFDIYINGVLFKDDADDIPPTACTSYTIRDIKPTTGHIYSGAVGNLSGSVATGQSITVKLKFDTCTNHTYDTGTITLAATCTKTGVMTYTCTKCNSTKTEIIPLIPHTPVVDPAVPATVISTGLTEGSHCSVCGTVIVAQEETPKLPRVLYDFDLDGIAEPVMDLPNALTRIEEESFEGGNAKVIIIPDGVTSIGSRAFASMPNLMAAFMPESVKTISFDAFDDTPNVTLYVQKGSRWGARLDLPSVEIEAGWIDESNIPAGAVVTDERWTYDYVVEGSTETRTSTTPITEEGWTLTKTEWETTSTGSQMCVDSYPSGYYGSKDYTTSKWAAFENEATKRSVTTNINKYIYWHWCFNSGYLSSGNYNVFVSDIPYETDSAGRYFQYFTAFESSSDAGHTDPNGANGGDCFYYWRDEPSDGSWWWWRIPVYRQTRIDYQKLYTYTKTTDPISESHVSDTPVVESDTIKNVKHEVQYSFR